MYKKIFIIFFIALFLAIACVNKVVYVPHGDAVKLRETIKKAKVWVKTKEGDIVPGTMDLPNGWFCLPLEENSPVKVEPKEN